MSVYFTDQVEITNVTRDVTFRTETEITPFLSKAYVEDEARINRGPLGAVVDPTTNIFLPKSTGISKGDYIRITKLNRITISALEQTGARKKVTKAFMVGGFSPSHIEVECKGGS